MLLCIYMVIDTADLRKYLEETLGIEVSIFPWKQQKTLPFFLLDTYAFFEMTLLKQPCLLMISKDDIELTPNTIQQHWDQVAKKWNGICIYISDTISSYNRKRLIQHFIPFIIPHNQIYLPDLGLDLREYFKQKRIHKKFFSPATQTVIISTLIRESEKLIPSELAASLGYSSMTMTRVFNELQTAGIGNMINKGKERWWIFDESKKVLWDQTNSMMRSPIRSRESMKLFSKDKMLQMPLAGLSALAEMTMLNPPPLPIYALGVEEYRQPNINKGLQKPPKDEASFEVEIWNYNPNLFSEQGIVDPFSLYLSLRDHKDERIQAALEEIMEKIKW